MSLVNLFYQTATSAALSAFGRRTAIGFVAVDVAIEMEHVRESEVTQFPVEFGATITDHVRMRPHRLEISGFVTDTPLGAGGINLGSARSSATYHLLQMMMEARQPIVVLTPRQLYTSMVIEHLSVPEGREASLRFKCSLVKVDLVFAQNAALPSTAETPATAGAAAQGGGTGKLAAGNVANPEHATGAVGIRAAAAEAPAQVKSWAASGADLVGGLF